MKLFILYLFPILTIVSCVTVKTSEILKLNFDSNKGSDNGGDFIKLNDGKIIKGKISEFRIVLENGIIKRKNKNITINNIEYKSNSVSSFQYDSSYYQRVDGSEIFMQRKKVGKINLYFRHFRAESYVDSRGQYKTSSAYDLHWLQKGIDGKIQKFSPSLLESMVSDNAEALNLVTKYKSAKRRQKNDKDIDDAIDIYNKN